MTLWTKVCGPTTAEGVRAIGKAGADAIGLNLVSGARRYLSPPDMRVLLALAREEFPSLERVAVTVNYASGVKPYAELVDAGFDSVQLHGDEPPALVRALVEHGLSVIKAVGLFATAEVAQAREAVHAYRFLGARLLVDARTKRAHGGTGKRLDLEVVDALLADGPIVLAGGLTPDNVSSALVRPGQHNLLGVDVASGVEKGDGTKDADLVASFVSTVRRGPQNGAPDRTTHY